MHRTSRPLNLTTPARPPRPPVPRSTAPGRRSFLTLTALTALTAAGASLAAGCGRSSDSGENGAPTNGASATSATSAGATNNGTAGWQDLDGHLLGHHATIRVSPLVRASDTATALVLEITRATDDAAPADIEDSGSLPTDDAEESPASDDAQDGQGSPDSTDDPGADPGTDPDTAYATPSLSAPAGGSGADGVRLIDTAGAGRVWTAGSASGGALEFKRGETITSTVVFGPVDIDEVIVFVPQSGFATVSVIGRDQAAGAGISSQALDEADEIIQDGGPGEDAAVAPLERYTQAPDNSAGTRTSDKDVTVTLSSDVTFDSDSAALSDKADGQLQIVAEQLAQYPDGGSLDIVGHTDDVADDAHNQKLSEDRAQAVRDRLAELADLGSWPDSVTGKGETEPAIDDTTDEARAANRRVVITITPTSGTTAKQPGTTGTATPSAPPASGTGLPEAKGPVGTGPDGVTVKGPEDYGGQITVTLDHITRNGGLLLGQLIVTTGPGGTGDTTLTGWLNDPAQVHASSRGESGGVSAVGITNGLTLLADGQRVYTADYILPGGDWHRPLTELYAYEDLKENVTTTICVVWPDTGQDTVTVDHPGGRFDDGYAFRLTDIPVITA